MLGTKLIHQTSDEYSSIEVVDYMDQIRALHFGNKTQQSACLLCNPHFLIHKYAQAMMLPLCWLKPERVLVIGLGAGSIVKYLYNYHPEIIIDTIELRSKVIELATEYFMLPEADERLNIFNDSANNWFNGDDRNKYDLIIVDVFLTSELDKDITVDISESFKNIENLLTTKGVAVFNHLGNDVHSYPGIKELPTIFKNQIYSMDIETTNSIIITSHNPIPNEISETVFNKMSQISTIPYNHYFNFLQPIQISD